MTRKLLICLLCVWLNAVSAQQLIINMAAIDGAGLTPENIFSFQMQSMYPNNVQAVIKGVIRSREGDHRITWKLEQTLQPGLNLFQASTVRPIWEFSSGALRELFLEHRMLPAGTYEYCISAQAGHSSGEGLESDLTEECLYHKVEFAFLIELMEPENDARIYEYNPLLSWVVTHPFAGMLSYRVRVAPIMEEQNNHIAITRNNPVYDERNLMQPSMVYPVYAKPLQKFQPYAWTVDAYYKGILLGGAEPWRFTIVEDSLLIPVSKNPSFIELNLEKGEQLQYAVGELKLKYHEREFKTNTLQLSLTDENGKEINLPEKEWMANRGDNRKVLRFHEVIELKHMKYYTLRVKSVKETYEISFRYINPLLIK